MGSGERAGGAPERALYGAGESVAQHFAALGRSGRRADFGISFLADGARAWRRWFTNHSTGNTACL